MCASDLVIGATGAVDHDVGMVGITQAPCGIPLAPWSVAQAGRARNHPTSRLGIQARIARCTVVACAGSTTSARRPSGTQRACWQFAVADGSELLAAAEVYHALA